MAYKIPTERELFEFFDQIPQRAEFLDDTARQYELAIRRIYKPYENISHPYYIQCLNEAFQSTDGSPGNIPTTSENQVVEFNITRDLINILRENIEVEMENNMPNKDRRDTYKQMLLHFFWKIQRLSILQTGQKFAICERFFAQYLALDNSTTDNTDVVNPIIPPNPENVQPNTNRLFTETHPNTSPHNAEHVHTEQPTNGLLGSMHNMSLGNVSNIPRSQNIQTEQAQQPQSQMDSQRLPARRYSTDPIIQTFSNAVPLFPNEPSRPLRSNLSASHFQFSQQMDDMHQSMHMPDMNRNYHIQVPLGEATRIGTGNDQTHRVQDQPQYNNRYERRAYDHGRDMKKRGIMYSASADGHTIDVYFGMIEQYRTIHEISDKELMAGISCTLKGPPLTWYWNLFAHIGIQTYDNFRKQLHKRFEEPLDCFQLLLRASQIRYDGKGDVLAHVDKVMPYLIRGGISAVAQVEVITCSLTEDIQRTLRMMHLHSVQDIVDVLKRLYPKQCPTTRHTPIRRPFESQPINKGGRAIAALNASVDECIKGFHNKSSSESESDTDADDHSGLTAQLCAVFQKRLDRFQKKKFRPTPGKSTIGKPNKIKNTTNRKADPNDKCYNCHQLGHWFQHCKEDQTRFFCYRCGAEDTLAKDCQSDTCKALRSKGNQKN